MSIATVESAARILSLTAGCDAARVEPAVQSEGVP
jgi:hypothetical protein